MKTYLIGALVISSSLLLAGCGSSGPSYSQADLETLGTCMSEKGLTMYGTERCPHCQQQKKNFGDAFSKVTYVDCDKESMQCTLKGVEGYPTRIDAAGNKYPGEQTMEKLAEIAGCAAPTTGAAQ